MSLTSQQIAGQLGPSEMVALVELVLTKYKGQKFDVISLLRRKDGKTIEATVELNNGARKQIIFDRNGKVNG